MKTKMLLAALLATGIGSQIVALAGKGNDARQIAPKAVQLRVEGELPSLEGATQWLNSPSLKAAGLRGNLVLVEFWTYTCINWLRTLAYVHAWAEKYKIKDWR